MAAELLVRATPAIEYTGTNAQEILDAIQPQSVAAVSLTLVSEQDGVATFQMDMGGPATVTISAGDWVEVGQVMGVQTISYGGLGNYIRLSDIEAGHQ